MTDRLTMAYDEGYDTGTRFREMEERGWDPGNTYLAVMINHKDDQEWRSGFEHGVNGGQRKERPAGLHFGRVL